MRIVKWLLFSLSALICLVSVSGCTGSSEPTLMMRAEERPPRPLPSAPHEHSVLTDHDPREPVRSPGRCLIPEADAGGLSDPVAPIDEPPAHPPESGEADAGAGMCLPPSPPVGGEPPGVTDDVREPIADLLPTITCSDRRLNLSANARGLVSDNYTLWHLCYQTPSRARMTSPHPLAVNRPHYVSFSYFDERDQELRQMALQTAPRRADPWTASFLIAMPPGTRPLFNLENGYPTRERLAAVEESTPGDPVSLHGQLRVWRVDETGNQTTSSPAAQVSCTHLRTSGALERFFLPGLACPHGFASCSLSSYTCEDILP